MADIVLKDITSGYNYSRVTYNFQVIQDIVNNGLLHLSGGNNTMSQDLDMNSNKLLNVWTDPNDPESLVTVGDASKIFLRTDGSNKMSGPLDLAGNLIRDVGKPIREGDAVRLYDLLQEAEARREAYEDVLDRLSEEAGYRASADMNLQEQISSGVPMASAFSVISWHDQKVSNSITIPPNKNAWSFGPTITVEEGVVVNISEGSHWTIADGEVYE